MTEGYGPNAPALLRPGGARRHADRLRRLRHRRGRGAGRGARRGRRDRAGPPQGRGSAAARSWPRSIRTGWTTAPAWRSLCAAGGGLPDRGGDGARAAPAPASSPQRAEPDLLATARPGGAGDGLRRDAADRGQPRAGLPGAEGHGAARPARPRRAARRGADPRPAERVHLRLRAGPAHQRRRPDQRGRSRAAAAAERGPGGGGWRSRRCWTPSTASARRSRPRCWTPRLPRRRRRPPPGHAALLVCGEGWHPGVVGIVAGRIKERFNRPACVAGIADGVAKGSGRSVAGLDLGAAVIAARQAGILTTGGGHPMAAGFSLAAARIEAFHAFLDERLAAAAALPSAADLAVEGTLAVAGCDDRAGAASGAAGAVRRGQRGADAGAAARAGAARRPGGAGGRPRSAPSWRARAAGRG